MGMHCKNLGQMGEAMAKDHLLREGYVILEQNWRYGRLGEIDLIAYHPGQRRLVFIEVKSRTSARYGHALEAITPRKQQTLYQLGQAYLQQAPPEPPPSAVSFDVITIESQGNEPPRLNHYPAAF